MTRTPPPPLPTAPAPAQPAEPHVGTLARVLLRHAQERPHAAAVTADGRTLTYGELAADVARIASSLTAAGLGPGDRIAVVARNGLPWVQLIYAASWSGVALVGVNWRLSPAEAEAILADSDPRVVFAEQEWADLVGNGREVVWTDGGLAEWSSPGDVGRAPAAGRGADSVVLQLYTTGTTGEPKGVQLSERNLEQMSLQATVKWRMHPDMRFLGVLPMFHVSGMSSVVTCVHMGGEVVVPAGTAVEDIGTAVQERGVTHTVLVPTVLTSLVADKAADRFDFRSLEVLVYGSAPSGSSLIEQAMAMLPWVGFSQGYGLTETCAGVVIAPILRHGDPEPRPGTVGTVNENCELRIVDPSTGQDVPAGGDGEIWVRSPQTTPGYWNKPAATAAAISPDGWLRTGDIGCLDEDGFLFIRDRLKDVIISGGENIYSVEVENAITAHPGVLECAVYGVPHPHWGESVKAVVVARQGVSLTEQELMAFVDGRLARYKRPRLVELAESLPKTGSGKILKRALRDRDGSPT